MYKCAILSSHAKLPEGICSIPCNGHCNAQCHSTIFPSACGGEDRGRKGGWPPGDGLQKAYMICRYSGKSWEIWRKPRFIHQICTASCEKVTGLIQRTRFLVGRHVNPEPTWLQPNNYPHKSSFSLVLVADGTNSMHRYKFDRVCPSISPLTP